MSFSGAFCEGTLVVESAHDINDLPPVRNLIFRNKHFDTLKNLFQHCKEIESVKFDKCVVVDGNMSYVFNDCKNLKTVDMSGLTFTEKPYCAGAFTHCYSLHTLKLPLFIRDMHLKFIPFHITSRVAENSSIAYTVRHFKISMKKDKQMFSLVKNKEGTLSTSEQIDRRFVKPLVRTGAKQTREAKIFLINPMLDERQSITEEVTVNEYIDATEIIADKDVMAFDGYIDIIIS